MRLQIISSLIFAIVVMLNCTVHKKNNSKNPNPEASISNQETTQKTTTLNPNTSSVTANYAFPMAALPVFNYTPTTVHLENFKNKYPQVDSVSLPLLEMGHQLYNSGACIKCHPAKNILAYDDLKWARLIPDMSMRANISEKQKDALVKYIMAIKVTTITNNK